jgi:hypothetical protein
LRFYRKISSYLCIDRSGAGLSRRTADDPYSTNHSLEPLHGGGDAPVLPADAVSVRRAEPD